MSEITEGGLSKEFSRERQRINCLEKVKFCNENGYLFILDKRQLTFFEKFIRIFK